MQNVEILTSGVMMMMTMTSRAISVSKAVRTLMVSMLVVEVVISMLMMIMMVILSESNEIDIVG